MKRSRSKPTAKQRRLGFAAGLLLGRERRPKITPPQLYRREFKSATQKIGIRFSDRLRDAFRSCWLKIK